MKTPSHEYSAIRAEMLKWQDRRFDLVKHSTTVVTGLLGFKLVLDTTTSGIHSPTYWPLVSSLLLLYLSATNVLIWYCGVANSKLAAYILVFHEQGDTVEKPGMWESRLKLLKNKHLDNVNLNTWMALIQLVLALLALALPAATASFSWPNNHWSYLAATCAALCIVTLGLVLKRSYPRDEYHARWCNIRDAESLPRRQADA